MIASTRPPDLPDSQRIVVTGIHFLSPNGNDLASFRDRLLVAAVSRGMRFAMSVRRWRGSATSMFNGIRVARMLGVARVRVPSGFIAPKRPCVIRGSIGRTPTRRALASMSA